LKLGLYRALTPIKIAKIFNKKVILSGQGVLPMNNDTWEKYISNVLNKADAIYTRDFELGKKELDRIGVKSKVILGVDDAFTLPNNNNNSSYALDNAIGINISSFITPDLYDIFYTLANRLKNLGYCPIFNYFSMPDAEHAEKCSKKEFSVLGFSNPEEAINFYSQLKASIGMRYHSAIFSLGQKIPHVNIYSNEYQRLKIKAIEGETNIQCFGLDKKNIDKAEEYVLNAIKYQKSQIESFHSNWTEKANLAIKEIE